MFIKQEKFSIANKTNLLWLITASEADLIKTEPMPLAQVQFNLD